MYNNPLNLVDPTGLGVFDTIGGWLVGEGCGDDGLLGAVGGFLSDNAGTIATTASLLALITPAGWGLAVPLGLVSLTAGGVSAYGNARDGNYALAALDLVGVGLSGTGVVLTLRASRLTELGARALVGRGYLTQWFAIDAAAKARSAQQIGALSFGLGSLGEAWSRS